MTSRIDIIGTNGNDGLAYQSNPPTSSLTNAQQRQAAIDTGMCSDGRACGEHHDHFDDYCADCPNEPDHIPDAGNMIDIGTKYDSDKPRMDLIPPRAELLLAQVLTYGAEKYAPDNWRKVDNAHQRYLAATLRHINAHRQGEKVDPESGLPHLAHAMCSLAFILELEDA